VEEIDRPKGAVPHRLPVATEDLFITGFREALRHSRRSREGRRRDDVSGIPIEAPGHACDVRGGAAVSENP